MKKFSKIVLSALLTTPLILNNLAFSAAAVSSAAAAAHDNDAAVELVSEDIVFEYVSTVYNGKEQKPVISVMSENTQLVENTDFTVQYPDDCVNAGKKTVTIKGIGKYKGTFSATYLIEALDCSENNDRVKIDIAECFYSGMPLMPEVTVTANGMTLGSGDYMIAFSNNVNVTSQSKAKCTITFRGNFSGKRTVDFDIAKKASEDIDIRLMVHQGDSVVYDLTQLKPAEASFGTIKYYSWDLIPEHQPKVAFNELSFVVPEDLTGSTAIVIPVIGTAEREDYNIIVYPSVTDKIIPSVIIKSPDRAYDGEPISDEVFAQNGSYAAAGGKLVEGTWEFRTQAPLLPCNKQPCVVAFYPTDPQYANVDTVVYITISGISVSDFALKPHRAELSLGQPGQLVISGIPEDYKGEIKLSFNEEELGVIEVACNDLTKREYEVDFPVRSGRYTFTAELSGDGIYLPASSQCSITVGNYVPPEDKPSDKVTTVSELTALINSAAEGDTVKAEGMRSIPAELVKAAYDKHLILEVKLNDTYTWSVDTAYISEQEAREALDLDISTAVIPAVLLNNIGGENICSFNIYAKNLGNGSELCVSSENKENYSCANLFLYSTSGELKFVSCALVTKDGTARLDIRSSGKYAVILDNETKLFGDIDNNCKLDINDVSALLEGILYMPSGTEIAGKYLKYDINGDKDLSIVDVVDLLDMILYG